MVEKGFGFVWFLFLRKTLFDFSTTNKALLLVEVILLQRVETKVRWLIFIFSPLVQLNIVPYIF